MTTTYKLVAFSRNVGSVGISIEQANVSGINLDYENSTTTDENGNQHNQTGTFIKTDGSTGLVHDVWFDADMAA